LSAETPDGWGRVDEHGTAFVRTSGGERSVGQWPGGDPAEILAFFKRRFEGLRVEIGLLERRVRDGRISAGAASTAVAKLRSQVSGAQAIGDLDSLAKRLATLEELLAAQREERRSEREARVAKARVRKEELVAEAQKVARGTQWRSGDNRMQELLAEWKSLERLDKDSDAALWRAFSTARATFVAARRQHFSRLAERRAAARQVKEGLVEEAEALADSSDWGPTSGRFRDLMQRWKAVGPAPKGVDERLWARFRAAQDRFFTARNEANAATETQFAENAKRKAELLAEAEALVPVRDARAARTAFRDIARRWDEAGKVPRAVMKSYDTRFRRVEQAVLGAEDDRSRRSNPEVLARAETTVAKLESSIAQLESALASAQADGDGRRVREAEQALAARRSWLEQAARARDEFSLS
jgi:hypothetical protein